MGQLSLCGMDAMCASSADEALSMMRHAAAAGGRSRRRCSIIRCRAAMAPLWEKPFWRNGTARHALDIAHLLGSARRRAHVLRIGVCRLSIKPVTQRDLMDCLTMVLGTQAEDWRMATQPIVTRHALRSQRMREAAPHFAGGRQHGESEGRVPYPREARSAGRCRRRRASCVDAWQTGRYHLILMDCQMPSWMATKRREKSDNTRLPASTSRSSRSRRTR